MPKTWATTHSTGGGSACDFLSPLVNAPNVITNADATLVAATVNVVKATTGPHTQTLPAPTAGLLLGIEITYDSTDLVTLMPSGGGDHIQPGNNTSRIMWAGEWAMLRANGTDWIKVAGVSIPMVCSMNNGTQSVAWNSLDKVTLVNVDNDNTGMMADVGNNEIVHIRAGEYSVYSFWQWETSPFNYADIWSIVDCDIRTFQWRGALGVGSQPTFTPGGANLAVPLGGVTYGTGYQVHGGATALDLLCRIGVYEVITW